VDEKDVTGAVESCIGLLESVVVLVYIEDDDVGKRDILQEGLEACEALFELNIEVQECVLALLYSWSSWLRYYAALPLPDADQGKASGDRSVEHGRLALKLAFEARHCIV